MSTQGISLVATSYNLGKEGILDIILEAWCRQTVQADEYLLIDVMSTDNTVEVVEKYKDRIPVSIIHRKENSNWSAGAIFFGMSHVAYDKSIICHAECLFKEDCIELMINNLSPNKMIRPGIYTVNSAATNSILNASSEDRWDIACAIGNHGMHPHSPLGFHPRPAWTAAFYTNRWAKGMQECPTISGYGPDDIWFQRNGENIAPFEFLDMPLMAHLRHTMHDHALYTHPTECQTVFEHEIPKCDRK